MQYDVEVNGRVRHVHVQRVHGGFLVSVDGREWAVDAARIDAYTLSLLTGTASHEVTIAPDPVSGQLVVGIGAVPLSVAVNGRRRWGRKDETGDGNTALERLVAPMPGKIVRVLVTVGETVRRRQPLVVIEAMKMENELRASRDGAVAEVLVKEGQLVDAGALLLVVAPV